MNERNKLQSKIHNLTLEILTLKLKHPYAAEIQKKQIKLDQLLDVQRQSAI